MSSDDVWILGIHMTKFGKRPDSDVVDLAAEATMAALADGGVTMGDVGVLAAGNLMGGGGVGQQLQKQVGQTGIPVYNVANACATGATALRVAYMAVKSGETDTGLAVGVEKLAGAGLLGGGGKAKSDADTWQPKGRFGAVAPIDGRIGTETMPGVFAQIGMEYGHRYGGTSFELFAKIAEKNHAHSTLNPLAAYQKRFSLEEIMNDVMISYPNTRPMCSANCDGAAAAVIVSDSKLKTLSGEQRRRAVKISASVLTTDPWQEACQVLPDVNTLTRNAAQQAYEKAGLGPEDLDMVELHDCFATAELVHYDNLMLCEQGGAVDFFNSGATWRDGKTPVNVSGGLESKGHPISATGIANIWEVATHLRGEAGSRQIEGAKVGLAHVIGLGSACGVHIFGKGRLMIEELQDWLKDNWDPDLTVEQWWERLGLSGWAAPTLRVDAYGRGLSRSDAVRAAQQIAAFGALGAPSGLGLLLAAPTIVDHGTTAQIETYVRDIVTGKAAWCQLFSEPGAGSDLAGLTTRAVADGEEYVVNGQKVWTSMGHTADYGMLLARTNPDVPKHQGISYFALEMHQPGIDVRPLREMTGQALFNEVFISDARVPQSAIIGDLHAGWRVANTTLGHERAGLGAGGGGGAAGLTPGSVAGYLDKRAGDFVQDTPARQSRAAAAGAGSARANQASLLIGLAKGNGQAADPVVRQGLVQLYTLGEIGRFNAERVKASRAQGRDLPGMANIAKLSMSHVMRLSRDLSLQIVGAQGMLHGYTDSDRDRVVEATGNPFLPGVTGMALFAQGPPIYGGTDQIQRNIIGERVLGLPKEPSQDKELPFSALPKNG